MILRVLMIQAFLYLNTPKNKIIIKFVLFKSSVEKWKWDSQTQQVTVTGEEYSFLFALYLYSVHHLE